MSSAGQYLSRVERILNRILDDKEHGVQAARLSLALSDLYHMEEDANDKRFSAIHSPDYYNLAPASSPTGLRITRASTGGSSPPAIATHHVQKSYVPETNGLLSPVSPTFPVSRTSSPGAMNGSDDMRSLRRLLMRKIPSGLTRAADEIDSTAVWLGVVQGVIRNVECAHL